MTLIGFHGQEAISSQAMFRVQDVAKDPQVVKDGQPFSPMEKPNKKSGKMILQIFFASLFIWNGGSIQNL